MDAHRTRWFDNHHWIFPMTPARFIESNCLKCHHEVVELEPSERFPEPPAPKLVRGYELVANFGCFGCHEINGFDGPNKRIGPDLRTEPNFGEVAAQILHRSKLERRRARLGSDACSPARRRCRSRSIGTIDSRRRGTGCQGDSARLRRWDCRRGPTAATSDSRHIRPRRRPEGRRSARPAAQGRSQPASPGFEGRLRLALQLDSPPGRLPPDDADAAVLRPLRAPGRREQGLHDHAMRPATRSRVTDREYTERFEAIEIRALVRVPARQQPAVRIHRSAAGRHRSAVGRARQVAVRVARLPGLPLARGFPGHRLDPGPRSVARRGEVQHRQGPALAL